MRRCIVVSSRLGEDSKTKEPVLYLTLNRLPNRMKEGNLWYPKREDLMMTTSINAVRKPELYERMKSVLPGTLVDIEYGLNEFNDKKFVASVCVVPGTENPFGPELLFV